MESNDVDRLFKEGQTKRLFVFVERKRAPVEKKFVLPSHLVHIQQRHAVTLYTLPRNLEASLRLAMLEGRGVQHDEQRRLVFCKRRCHFFLPHVLAHHDAQPQALKR